jgi:hypothetical protein
VSVQRLDRKRWVVATTYAATPARAAHTLTGLVAGATYRVSVPATAAITGYTSGTVKLS